MASPENVNLSFIHKARYRYTLPTEPESQVLHARRLTHLCMQDRAISKIGDLSCKNLTVLYLQDNKIEKIENLQCAVNLTSLFLQNNNIKKIENLGNLLKLTRLYLSRNEISVVEGLQNLQNLEELYLEKQNLKDGDAMCFDPRSIAHISQNLAVLNVSNNNITSIAPLAPLKYLKSLDAGNNRIGDIQDVCDTIKPWYNLCEATFAGNPVCKKHRYKENIIASTQTLRVLDKKDITDVTRCFIQRFEREKSICASRPSVNLSGKLSSLSKSYPPALQRAVSKSILHDVKKSLIPMLTDNVEDTQSYVQWKALPPPKIKKKVANRKEIVSTKHSIVFNPFI